MPVDFLSDAEAAKYARYDGPPTRVELEKIFFLDDEDRALIARRRGEHMKLGFALQMVTVRYLGCFLTDPLAVPNEVLDAVADQLVITDPSCVKRYTQREKTRLDHAWEIQQVFELKDFAAYEADLAAKVDARARNSGDGPTAIFQYAVRWLRENDVLLPGITTLTRLIARVRDDATQRLWDTLHELLTPEQRFALNMLLEVSAGRRVSELERWRTAPSRASGPGLVKALDLVSEIGAGFGKLDLDAAVPRRRLVELASYGMAARAAQLKKHPPARRLATLLATMRQLQTKTIDDALELLDLLMVTELLGKARREADKQKVRHHPKLAKASARLASAVAVLLGVTDTGEDLRLSEVWEMVEAVAPRTELRAAVATVTGIVPASDVDDDGGGRAEMASRYVTVSGFIRMLPDVIEFGQRRRRAGAGRAGQVARHAGLPAPPPFGDVAAAAADRPLGGDRGVEAAGIRLPGPRKRAGRPQRVRVLRARRAVPPAPQTPRYLRHGFQPLARSQRPAPGGRGVGCGKGQRADRPGPARGP
ncbi:MAG: DUF4158 domain-containing protein [Frankiaceae bacterium]